MRLVWLSGTAALLLFGAIAYWLAPLKPSVLSLQLAFSARTFGEIVHNWTPEQLQIYRDHFACDFGLLIAYSCFGYMLAARTKLFIGVNPGLVRIAKWSLPFAAVCDGSENFLHLWLTAAPRFGVPSLYVISASLSSIKWILLITFGCIVIHALSKDEV